MRYQNVVLGGTFDHFHAGHRKLLEKAYGIGETVTIGITSDSMVRGKWLSGSIESLKVRRLKVEKFLKEKKWQGRSKLVTIHDIFGPTLAIDEFDAIVVSSQTKSGARRINEERKKRGMKQLEVVVVPDVLGDDGKLVTSERIRAGEIDRDGQSYKLRVHEAEDVLLLPKEMREELRKPLGLLIEGREDQLEETAKKSIEQIDKIKPVLVIAVGDIIVHSLLQGGFKPDIAIVDYRTRRTDFNEISRFRDYMSNARMELQMENKAGTININAAKAIKEAIGYQITYPLRQSEREASDRRQSGKKYQFLVVEGEEDLLALPAMLYAPLGAVVLYGQIDMGVVMIEVTEEKKEKIRQILRSFTSL